MLLGVDTGGTFTDFVLLDGTNMRLHKVLSTPDDPSAAIQQGIRELGLDDHIARGQVTVIHGSTVETNAALEGKGVRTAYITNRGFTDLLQIGRQARRDLYSLTPRPSPEPVPTELLIGTGGRIAANGDLVDPLTEADLDALRERVIALRPEAIAVNLLFSYVDDRYERKIESALEDLAFVCRSSFVLPEYKEYERGIATWLNAWLGPIVERYLSKLSTAVAPCPVVVMQSSGGTIGAAQARRRAVNLLLSGPAGGLAAAQHVGNALGRRDLLTFDMGGTSTDVSLIDERAQVTNEGFIGPYPVARSHTSIASGFCTSARDLPARSPGLLVTERVVSNQRSPTPTSCWGVFQPRCDWAAHWRCVRILRFKRLIASRQRFTEPRKTQPEESSRSRISTWHRR